IVKRFEFVHGSAYMTVLVSDPADGSLHVFMKGSFEKIRDVVDPQSLPGDYEAAARRHAAGGAYTLALAHSQLPAHFTAAQALSMARSQLEDGARLLGLCLFRNELKDDAGEALEDLRDAGCRVVMITGDSVDTGVAVARRCGMIRGTEAGAPVVLVGDLDGAAVSGGSGRVVWREARDAVGTAAVADGDGAAVVVDTELERMLDAGRRGYGRPVELAVTGKAFNALTAAGRMRGLLFETRVFARMSPEDKVACVRLHMEKAVTAMCGDGGNDAGALKAAHAGIALSEAESSVVSHFSSRNRRVGACVELLREARCSLDISFASYRFLVMYGEVLTFLGLVQYYFTVNMSQAMWILIDGSTVPLSWALTQARPPASGRLSRARPTARLLGPETVASVVLQILVNVSFLVGGVVLLFQNKYSDGFLFCSEFDGRQADVRRWWELADNYEGEVTGLLGAFQVVNAAFVANLSGARHRGAWFRNYALLGVWAAAFALLSLVLLTGPNPLTCAFRVNCGTAAALSRLGYDAGFAGVPDAYFSYAGHNVMPTWFRWRVWVLAVANLAAGCLVQSVGVLGFGRTLAKRWFPQKRLIYRT
ncbi:hypothetical protein HK405_014383, partial [Cladochytrium tenue]